MVRSSAWSWFHQSMTSIHDTVQALVRQSWMAAYRQAMCTQHQCTHMCSLLCKISFCSAALHGDAPCLLQQTATDTAGRHKQVVGSLAVHTRLIKDSFAFGNVYRRFHFADMCVAHLHPWCPAWEECAESSGPTEVRGGAPCWQRLTPYPPSDTAGSCPPVRSACCILYSNSKSYSNTVIVTAETAVLLQLCCTYHCCCIYYPLVAMIATAKLLYCVCLLRI